ncbi:MAG: copper chaperone PCu(A)C [Pseudomonadota bacterium]|nr:copper chaperone PCu(A)C [Pseudomonadota bacterium]
MKVIRTIVLAAAIATALSAPVSAHSHKMKGGMHGKHGAHGPRSTVGIKVKKVWARATPGKARNGAGYVTVVNAGKTNDRLVDVKSEVAKRVEIHSHLMDNGVMRMRKVEGIDLRAGGSVVMKPGGYHVMFIGLYKPLIEGESFPVTLVFRKAGEVKALVKIMSFGAMGGDIKHDPEGHGSHGSHSSHSSHKTH